MATPLTHDDIETVRREAMARLYGVNPEWRRAIQILTLAAQKRAAAITPDPPVLGERVDENTATKAQLQQIADALKAAMDPENDPDMLPLRELIQKLVP